MGMALTYIAKSASVAGVALTGATSFTVKKTGQVVDTRSDGELFARVSPLVNVEETIEVEAKDVGIAPALGATGTTICVGSKHNGGVALSGTVTCTATKSTVTDVQHTLNMDGTPVVRVTLRVESSDGQTSGIAWTSA